MRPHQPRELRSGVNALAAGLAGAGAAAAGADGADAGCLRIFEHADRHDGGRDDDA